MVFCRYLWYPKDGVRRLEPYGNYCIISRTSAISAGQLCCINRSRPIGEAAMVPRGIFGALQICPRTPQPCENGILEDRNFPFRVSNGVPQDMAAQAQETNKMERKIGEPLLTPAVWGSPAGKCRPSVFRWGYTANAKGSWKL